MLLQVGGNSKGRFFSETEFVCLKTNGFDNAFSPRKLKTLGSHQAIITYSVSILLSVV